MDQSTREKIEYMMRGAAKECKTYDKGIAAFQAGDRQELETFKQWLLDTYKQLDNIFTSRYDITKCELMALSFVVKALLEPSTESWEHAATWFMYQYWRMDGADRKFGALMIQALPIKALAPNAKRSEMICREFAENPPSLE